MNPPRATAAIEHAATLLEVAGSAEGLVGDLPRPVDRDLVTFRRKIAQSCARHLAAGGGEEGHRVRRVGHELAVGVGIGDEVPGRGERREPEHHGQEQRDDEEQPGLEQILEEERDGPAP